MIWKSSTSLGFGASLASKGEMTCAYVVGRYKKAGNALGQFGGNVMKGDFDTSMCSKLLHGNVLVPPNKDGVASNQSGPEANHAGLLGSSNEIDGHISLLSIEQAALRAHNKFRGIHQSPHLSLDNEMSQSAQQYAIKLSKMGTLTHSSRAERDNAGENLGMECSKVTKEEKVQNIIRNWYLEVCDPGYIFNKGQHSFGSSHFTQIVWKSSRKFGIGVAVTSTSDSTCAYVVARYKEPGNMLGMFERNVLKGSFDRSVCKKFRQGDPVIISDDNTIPHESHVDQDVIASTSSQKNASLSTKQVVLRAHNKYREIHQSPPLSLDNVMSRKAQQYAVKLLQKGTLMHASPAERDNAGENLGMECSRETKEEKILNIIRNWYAEVCNPGYKFSDGDKNRGSGHFTQLVWKSSTKLGIGVADGPLYGQQCVFMVARYTEPGNMMGRYMANVLEGRFDESMCASLNPDGFKTVKHDVSEPEQRDSGVLVPEDRPREPSLDNTSSSSYDADALELHNRLRATHDSPPLVLSSELSSQAEKYAKRLAELNNLVHDDKANLGETGENLAMSCSSSSAPQSVQEAIRNWYAEVCLPGYDFSIGEHHLGSGEFSQMVWKSVSDLGIGSSTSIRGGVKCTFFVARYRPAGNIAGRYTENVQRGSFNFSMCSSILNPNPFMRSPSATDQQLPKGGTVTTCRKIAKKSASMNTHAHGDHATDRGLTSETQSSPKYGSVTGSKDANDSQATKKYVVATGGKQKRVLPKRLSNMVHHAIRNMTNAVNEATRLRKSKFRAYRRHAVSNKLRSRTVYPSMKRKNVVTRVAPPAIFIEGQQGRWSG